MTFITGPNLATKTTLLIDSKAQEHVVEMCKGNGPAGLAGAPHVRVESQRASLFVFLAMFLSVVFICAAVLYFMPTETERLSIYRGYCTIPIRELFGGDHGAAADTVSHIGVHVVKNSLQIVEHAKDIKDGDELRMRIPFDYNVMPVRWSQDEADVQMFRSGAPVDAAEELLKTLRERFDIGDQVEKISVMDNGKRVNFIHDFEQNTTDIEDTERCYTTDLDHETVLPPSLLLLSIENGAVFEISRIRSALVAELPALRSDAIASALREACMEKPVYRLIRQEFNIIRKRSADAPAHDFIQFSGRGVQEIEISNLAEILQHEQDAAIAQR